MSPAVLAALLALLAEAIKDTPEIIADVEALIHPSTAKPAPMAPGVVADMATDEAKLTAKK